MALLIGLPIAVSAQTETLSYVGIPFTSLDASGNLANALANAPRENTGTIVLSSPLGDNFNGTVTPLAWSFDANTEFGDIYLNQNDPQLGVVGNSQSFAFTTDASGELTAWSITIDGGTWGGTNSPSWADVSIISSSGDSFFTGFSSPTCAAPPGYPVGCYEVSESNSNVGFLPTGSWTSKVDAAPEFDAGTSASALTLLLGSLVILRDRLRWS
jgi:hypothetical protein